ncbi:MAG TPA: hypothetical protein VHA56_18130 [Mucilaginibacter sp.]|nr:hypothetical protein [Mucilaginibacter sp.]
MKKLTLAIITIFTIIAFKPDRTFKFHNAISVKDTISTLNGITIPQANARVTLSVGTADKKPANEQIWFRREVVEAWYSLLLADQKRGIKADGIRIYLSRILATPQNPIHRNNGIIVVSTFSKDTLIDNKDSIIHKDYFTHLDSNKLFKMADIKGKIYFDNDAVNGAALYDVCNCDITTPCSTSSEHEILRSKAESMVQNFRGSLFRSGAINSTAEWFDIKMLKYLLTKMEEDKDDDGVRIYFARGIDNDYAKGKVKFVFVTTKPGNTTDTHSDYLDCEHFPLINKISDPFTGPTDNGELCPTHCQGITLPQP